MENDKVLKRLRNMIAYVPVATIAFDTELRVLEWNEAAGRLFGVVTQNAIDRNVADFFVTAKDSDPSIWRDLVDRQAVAEVTATGRLTDGTPFPVHIVCLPLVDPRSNPEYVLYVAHAGYSQREIEALRKTDEAQQRADLLNAIADGEINAPEVAIQRGRSLGMDLATRYALFAISIDDYAGKSYSELQKDQRGMKDVLRKVTQIC